MIRIKILVKERKALKMKEMKKIEIKAIGGLKEIKMTAEMKGMISMTLKGDQTEKIRNQENPLLIKFYGAIWPSCISNM